MPYALNLYPSGKVLVYDKSEARRCWTCEIPTHRYEERFSIDKTVGKDFSYTADGFNMVSRKGRAFLEANATSEIEFFDAGRGYSVIRPVQSIFWDMSNASASVENEFGNGICPRCGRAPQLGCDRPWDKVFMAGERKIGEFDIVRGEQLMGFKGKEILDIIVGDGLMAKMKAAKLSGVQTPNWFDQPEGMPHWEVRRSQWGTPL